MKPCLFFSLLLLTLTIHAQDTVSAKDKEAAYEATITSRAQKIVDKLSLDNSAAAATVTKLIAAQYKNLNDVYATRDLQVKAQKENTTSGSKASLKTSLEMLQAATLEKTAALHKKFISDLAAHLNPTQVDQIKDGMTYGVLQVTYKGYNDMIPTLTDKQKEQIMTWLIEAREFAMDAESSEKKHAWFGKYKGRINNYLSAAGYDLQKERAGWQERLKAANATKSN